MEIPIRSTPTIGKHEVRRQSRSVRAVRLSAARNCGFFLGIKGLQKLDRGGDEYRIEQTLRRAERKRL